MCGNSQNLPNQNHEHLILADLKSTLTNNSLTSQAKSLSVRTAPVIGSNRPRLVVHTKAHHQAGSDLWLLVVL